MGPVKHYIHVCYLVSFLVFKSSKATAPVLLTKWDGTVSSPNYPFTYPTNTTLTWIKTVSSGNRITITIDDFQTQCEGDYLEIRDGDSAASPVLAKFCGRSGARQSVSSSGTHMLLRFVSDNVTDSFNSRGFNLRHSGVCKVQTNATSGVITTPQYPDDYLNYMDCLWTIKLHPSMLIALECDDIALEYEEDCRFDYMEILAGVSLDDAPVLGRFCGIYNHSLTFERDGTMSIRFVSDADKELSGFRCAYNVDKGSSSPPMVPPTQTSPLLFTRERIISPTQNQSKITSRYTINMSETILSNFNAIHSSSLNTPQNGVTLCSDVTRSSNHIFTLVTKREILHSTEQSSEDVTRSSDHTFSLSTISKILHSNVAFPSSDSQNTEMVHSSRTFATSSISGSHVGVLSSRSESYQVNPVLSWGRKTVETKTDPGHIETISISHTIATSTTRVCCEGSSVHWPRAMESSKHQANRGSVHATEMLQMVTAQETSYFKVSFDWTAGSEMEQAEIKTSSSTQSPLSTSQVRTTLSRLSITISPSRTAPSSSAVDSTTSTLTFPWHLIPFVVIVLVIFVALVTYCLRIPDITEKIFLALKERKKPITRSRQEKSFDVMKGDVLKNFEASTFHSYQRELFYDATLNYAMFEQSTTRAIEFSIHLDEEDQSTGPEEAVEISCVLGDEPANGKQGGGSLSEMFDKQ